MCRSDVFAGNVSAESTLAERLEALGTPAGGLVIRDRGVATAAHLAWLRAHGTRDLVVTREDTRVFDNRAANLHVLTTASRGEVQVETTEIQSEDETGTLIPERRVHGTSAARAAKEQGIIDRFRPRCEDGLTPWHANLSPPGRRQRRDCGRRAVGRLQKENARVARHETVTVTPDDTGQTAASVTGVQNTEPGSLMDTPGVDRLRTHILDGDAAPLWRAYAGLTEVESVFRALKSERGLRPIFHHRCAGRMAIC